MTFNKLTLGIMTLGKVQVSKKSLTNCVCKIGIWQNGSQKDAFLKK
jgi:hypothetical protein